jgi:hypothetical protein
MPMRRSIAAPMAETLLLTLILGREGMAEDLATLMSYVQENGRVCPLPDAWQQVYELLPERRQVGAGYEPAPPLILGGWHYSSNLDKMVRLRAHLEWAASHGALDLVGAALRKLARRAERRI